MPLSVSYRPGSQRRQTLELSSLSALLDQLSPPLSVYGSHSRLLSAWSRSALRRSRWTPCPPRLIHPDGDSRVRRFDPGHPALLAKTFW